MGRFRDAFESRKPAAKRPRCNFESAATEDQIAAATRALVLGIGGGGDAVGSLSVARHLEARGLEWVLGGVAWERFVVDPYPGPRSLAEIHGGTPLGHRVGEAAARLADRLEVSRRSR